MEGMSNPKERCNNGKRIGIQWGHGCCGVVPSAGVSCTLTPLLINVLS
jgi:hypothetical protein